MHQPWGTRCHWMLWNWCKSYFITFAASIQSPKWEVLNWCFQQHSPSPSLNEGMSFEIMVLHPSSRLSDTCRISAESQWSCSGWTWCPCTLLINIYIYISFSYSPSILFNLIYSISRLKRQSTLICVILSSFTALALIIRWRWAVING